MLTNNEIINTIPEISDKKYQLVENIEDIPEQFRNWVQTFLS